MTVMLARMIRATRRLEGAVMFLKIVLGTSNVIHRMALAGSLAGADV